MAVAYLVALLAVAASLLLRLAFSSFFGQDVPYLEFFPAVIVASWYGGLGPGLATTGATALAAAYFFLPPAGLAVSNPVDVVSLALFTSIGAVIALLQQRLGKARQSIRTETENASGRAERLDAIINTTVDGIIVIDSRGRIESFNPGAQRLFGYTEAEVVGRNVNVLMPSPYHEQHDGYLSHYVTTGEARIIGKGREVTGRRKDGSTFPLHLSVGQTVMDGQRRFTGILHDLTERVELEERLREQSALAKLGEMAAVIAHEVKNPLAGIRGAVQVIGGRLPPSSTDAMMMKEVVARIDSLDAMMKDLLLFARPPKPKLTPIDVVPLLQVTADLLKRDDDARGVEFEVAGASPPVKADPEMLKMVFQNLLLNGVHAIDGRGRIRVGVDTNGNWCRIAIADNGPGIPPDIRDKIFMPFFTTKSRGTGLGLPTSKRFIDAHDGRISIDCPPSGGTTVTIQLPAS